MGLTCFDMPKCMKTGGACTLHKNYDFTAGEVEVQPLSASHTLPLNSNPGTNVYFVYCVVLVCEPISNANSLSYSPWLLVKDSNVILNMPTRCGHPIKRVMLTLSRRFTKKQLN